ncbi:MAG: hypothetical protein WCB19_07110 [Thermoplasmata archaeon]
MQWRRSNGQEFAAAMLLVGAALLLSSLFLGWYSMSLGSGSNFTAETFYPTSVQLWGSQGGSAYSAAASYSAIELGNTGMLYLAVAGLVVAGGLLGVTTAYLIWRSADPTPRLLALAGLRWRSSDRIPRGIVSALLVVTILLALAGPVAVAFAQPGAVCSDSNVLSTPFVLAYPNNTSGARLPCGWDMAMPYGIGYSFEWSASPGPQSSFFGTNNETGQVLSWGPSEGWYASLAGTAFLVLGALVYLRREQEPASGGSESQSDPTLTQRQVPPR